MNRTNGRVQKISCFKDRKVSRGSGKVTKKLRVSDNVLDEKDLSHILWWKEVSRLNFFHCEHGYYFFIVLIINLRIFIENLAFSFLFPFQTMAEVGDLQKNFNNESN